MKSIEFSRIQDRPVTDVDDDLVFLDADGGEYQVLRGTARRTWELLDRPMTLDELASALAEEYSISVARCAEEIQPFLEELTRLELVRADPG